MIVVWGTTNAGKVDEVPGLGHVCTRFGHLYYVPLFPTGSYVVLEQQADGGFRGVSIPISFKSWLVGWLRAGCAVTIIVAAIFAIIAIAEGAKHRGNSEWPAPMLMAVGAVAVLVMSYKLKFIRQASYERAVELANHVGLT